MATRKTEKPDDTEVQDAPAEDAPKAAPTRLDETVAGGRFVTADGRTVDANGEPVKD